MLFNFIRWLPRNELITLKQQYLYKIKWRENQIQFIILIFLIVLSPFLYTFHTFSFVLLLAIFLPLLTGLCLVLPPFNIAALELLVHSSVITWWDWGRKNSSDLNEFDISCPLCVCLAANLQLIQSADSTVSSFVDSSAQHRGTRPNLIAMKYKNSQSKNLSQASRTYVFSPYAIT